MSSDKLAWFRNAKYGLFIHWGLYAIPGGEWEGRIAPHGTEWIMKNLRIPLHDYRKLVQRFNPTAFDPFFLTSLLMNITTSASCSMEPD